MHLLTVNMHFAYNNDNKHHIYIYRYQKYVKITTEAHYSSLCVLLPGLCAQRGDWGSIVTLRGPGTVTSLSLFLTDNILLVYTEVEEVFRSFTQVKVPQSPATKTSYFKSSKYVLHGANIDKQVTSNISCSEVKSKMFPSEMLLELKVAWKESTSTSNH